VVKIMQVFSSASESQVTRAIVTEFTSMLADHIESDVIIVGAGPSGLMAGKVLSDAGVKTLMVERNNYLGGGFWIGGYLMNKLTVRAPADKYLRELGIPAKELDDGLFVADGPHACSKLIAAACDAGLNILNMTKFDDVVVREGRVAGAVVNWSPVAALPRQITCVDPIALESKYVVDATGHDAFVIASLVEKGIVEELPGSDGMWVDTSEDQVVDRTGEVYPGVMATGMAVSSAYHLPRMGPTFGGMLMSGHRVADIILRELGKTNGVAPVEAGPVTQ
jgi:thiamine thiazole synthase